MPTENATITFSDEPAEQRPAGLPARYTLDSLLARGTLPPLMLPPINFDALFQQALAQQDEQGDAVAH